MYRRRRLGARARRSPTKPMLIFLTTPLLVGIAVSCMGVFALTSSYYAGVKATAASPQEAITERGGGASIYDRNGVLLYQFLDEHIGTRTTVRSTRCRRSSRTRRSPRRTRASTTTPAST